MQNVNCLAVICLLMALGHSLTTTPFFNITDKYIETGTNMLSTTAYFGNISWVGVKQTTFSFAYQRTHNPIDGNIALQELKFLLTPSYELNASILICGFGTTSMTICLSSTALNYLQALKTRYLILDSGFDRLTIYNLYVYGNPSLTINSATPYTANFGLAAISQTGTARAFLAFMGLNVTAPNSNLELDIKATPTYVTSTFLRVKIETTVASNIVLGAVFLCFIGYNEQQVASWPFPAALLNYATFSGTSSSPAVYTDSGSLTRDFNTFWGFNRINFNNQASIHFTSDLTPSTSIQATSTTSFNDLALNVLVFQFKECDTTTPYYMMANDTCYDICPSNYYDNSQSLCTRCINYDCYSCVSTGACTACSNSTDFRVLNTTTNRCSPLVGYYDDGTNNSVAKPCDSSCKSCITTAIFCTACYDGFYLNSSNGCSACMANCQACSSAISCSNCSTYYYFDSGSSSCVSTINCSVIANCTTCNISAGCTVCIAGYNATNMTTCSPVCGDGIKLAFEACDDNNTANGDGCSSNCTIEAAHYCILSSLTSVCNNCSSHCSLCTTNTSCQNCSSPYLVNNITFACVPDCTLINLCVTCHQANNTNQTQCDSCQTGYVPVSNTCTPKCGDAIVIAPEECDDGNTTSGDGCSSNCTFQPNSVCSIVSNKSICSFCPAKKYAATNHSTCLSCSYECATCDATGCLTCNPLSNRALDNITHTCVPTNGFYDDLSNETAAPCSADCLTCSGGTNTTCLSCAANKILINNSTCGLCSLYAGIGCFSCISNSSNSNVTCLNCSGNLQNGTCMAIISLPSLPSPDDFLVKMMLMILLPILLGLCCCCLIIYCIWRRRRHEENKVDEEDGEKKLENPPLQPKIYKVDSKKLDGKIKNNDTEGNQLSMNEFKEINDIKVQVQVVKERSVVNDNMNMSENSDFSRPPTQSDDQNGRGCNY